jgi:hypothetical protein
MFLRMLAGSIPLMAAMVVSIAAPVQAYSYSPPEQGDQPLPAWFHTPVEEWDGAWYGANAGSAGLIVVNGIGATPGSVETLAVDASAEFGGVPVLGVYNLSGAHLALPDIALGPVNLSMLSAEDVFQAIADKYQDWTGWRLGSDNPAVFGLMAAIQATSNRAIVLAHSQGGAIASAALRAMAANRNYDLEGLRVVTIGSASFDFPEADAYGHPIEYEHRVHSNDIVPTVAGFGFSSLSPVFSGLLSGGSGLAGAIAANAGTLWASVGAGQPPFWIAYDPAHTVWRIQPYPGPSGQSHSHEAYFSQFESLNSGG